MEMKDKLLEVDREFKIKIVLAKALMDMLITRFGKV